MAVAQKAIDRTTLLLGLLPPFYVAAAVLVQLSIHGIIPFHMAIYSLWQYALIVHIITVLIIAILRVRAENRQLEQKQRLARELQIEREASFHQRQFMGMVAHEFRTPLAVIQAALENLRLSAASTSRGALSIALAAPPPAWCSSPITALPTPGSPPTICTSSASRPPC